MILHFSDTAPGVILSSKLRLKSFKTVCRFTIAACRCSTTLSRLSNRLLILLTLAQHACVWMEAGNKITKAILRISVKAFIYS